MRSRKSRGGTPQPLLMFVSALPMFSELSGPTFHNVCRLRIQFQFQGEYDGACVYYRFI